MFSCFSVAVRNWPSHHQNISLPTEQHRYHLNMATVIPFPESNIERLQPLPANPPHEIQTSSPSVSPAVSLKPSTDTANPGSPAPRTTAADRAQCSYISTKTHSGMPVSSGITGFKRKIKPQKASKNKMTEAEELIMVTEIRAARAHVSKHGKHSSSWPPPPKRSTRTRSSGAP